MKHYGMELILDLKNCDPSTFNRVTIKKYFDELCELIEMEQCELHFWDDVGVPENEKQTNPKTKGTSAIQFIMTSNVTIHTLDILKTVYINIFSCKDFNIRLATNFSVKTFNGKVKRELSIERG